MKTARDILAQHIMWAKADWTKDNYAQADDATTALEAAGYVVRSRQANWNAARMEAALIGIAAGEGSAADEAKAALKWCAEHPA